MHAHTDRDQFAPPRPPARLRAITLAVLVLNVVARVFLREKRKG